MDDIDPNVCPTCYRADCESVVAGADCPEMMRLQEEWAKKQASEPSGQQGDIG